MSSPRYVKAAAFFLPFRLNVPQDCKEEFVRVQQLSGHFEHAHRELLNTRVSIDAFAPLAVLAPPHHLQRPSPLPQHEIRTDSFLPSVSMPPIRRGLSQGSGSQSISRKWSRLNVQDNESNANPIEFYDLPSLEPQHITSPRVVDIEVRRKLPLSRQPYLSRPQPRIYPPIRSSFGPEQTILYSAFESMIDKLVADGTLAQKRGI